MRGKTVLCSFSGGPDSLALLLLLDALRKKCRFRLEAVHFEHGIRGDDSRADAAFCRKFCAEKAIPFSMFPLDVPKHKRKGEGDEEAARRLRLECWKKIISDPEQTLIALAHHAGDRAENIFLRLFRGANATGLTSMREMQKIGPLTLFRPLLGYTKAELEDFLRTQNITQWRHDATNDENRYRRNLIRNELLPLIREQFPFAEAGIAQSIQALTDDAAYLEDAAKNAFQGMKGDPSVERWRSLSPALLPRVLRRFLSRTAGEDIVPDSRLIRRFSAALALPCSGRERLIPLHGFPQWKIVIRNAAVSLRKSAAPLKAPSARWDYRKDAQTEFCGIRLSAAVREKSTLTFSADTSSAWFDAAEITPPLTLAVRQDGECMIPFGRKHPVTLKKLFTDAGIPLAERRSIPIVRDASGRIIWIPFVRHSAAAPVTERTGQVLELTAEHTV